VHCAQYARDLGVEKVIVPLGNVASVFSAFGIGSSPVRHVEEATAPLAEPFARDELEARFAPLAESIRAKLTASGFEPEQMKIERFADMKFHGQFYELELSLGEGELPESADLVRKFHDRYDQVYGKGAGLRSAGIEIVNVRVVGEGYPEGLVLPEPASNGATGAAPTTLRRMYWPTIDRWEEAPVVPAAALAPGAALEGPVVVEGAHTSIVVHPGDTLDVMERGTVSLTIGER
jgi:N-methylhydantoinase A